MALKNGRTSATVREILVGSVHPSGSVIAFAGTSAPDGWLLCDGSLVSRAIYSSLFFNIGIAHGSGDGSTTFHLPDYRGRFLRGVANTSALDPDRASRTAANAGGNTGDNVGSVQGQAFQTHNHTQTSHNHTQNSHNHTQDPHTHTFRKNGAGLEDSTGAHPGTTLVSSTGFTTNSTTATNNVATAVNVATTAVNVAQAATGSNVQATSNETRPVNAAVNYIIKI